ncbi:MAG: hypothetical protein JWM98_1390 [Thermoleophilia bacterium]|nr:hypothetical protein [Thermoleophilia bacterium]
MDLFDAIHTRRTTKEFRPDPVPRAQLERILEAARWAPNHRLTEPWRFRVVGPEALERLKAAAGGGAQKLLRAPTLVVASYVPSPLPPHAREDEHATAAAIYAPLLAATAEGVASYWRTINTFETPEGAAAVDLPAGERVLGLLHFGFAVGDLPPTPARRAVAEFVTFLP